MRPLAAALVAALAFPAAAAEPGWKPVPRQVLVLYSGRSVPDASRDVHYIPFHLRAEVVVNHLGLEAVYLDADRPLPDPSSFKDARAVMTWFADEAAFPDPVPLCRWLHRAMDGGKRWVLLGRTGLRVKKSEGQPVLLPECQATLARLGYVDSGPRPVDPFSAALGRVDPAFVGFERKPDPTENPSVPAVRLLPGATALLTVAFHDGGDPLSEPVALTPAGGFALDPFLLYVNREVHPLEYRWVTDPFAFFEAALGVRGLPRPDVTTLSGRRVYMSRVDGDGFFNRAELDPRKFSGEFFLREFLEKYPASPFTVSLIAGYYDLALYRTPEALTLSRLVFNRPNVEPASHGYAHPLVWSSGTVSLNIPRYSLDGKTEIVASARMLQERFLSSRRSVGLFLWTGDCLPSAEDLALPGRAGMLNMNGGGGRLDARFPSYSYLWPLSRVAGGARQVYAPSYNENDFTNLWTAQYYGYREARETFERTGAPRRVKPVDVYVHFFSAERHASLEALRGVYAWAHAQPLIPVWGSRYVRAVQDFFALKVSQRGPRRFLLSGGPALRTVRFDAPGAVVDLAASRGVVGFRSEPGSLYVHLDESDSREVVLGPAAGAGPWLEEANFEVSAFARTAGGVRFKKSGWWKGEGVLAGCAPGRRYRVTEGARTWTVQAASDGRLRLEFGGSERWGAPQEVRVEPAG